MEATLESKINTSVILNIILKLSWNIFIFDNDNTWYFCDIYSDNKICFGVRL